MFPLLFPLSVTGEAITLCFVLYNIQRVYGSDVCECMKMLHLTTCCHLSLGFLLINQSIKLQRSIHLK